MPSGGGWPKIGLYRNGVIAGLEEQLAGRGHGPGRLIHVERHVEVTAPGRRRRLGRLKRRGVVAQADPVIAAVVAAGGFDLERRAFAAMLVFGVEAEAASSRLSRQTPDDHLAVLHQTGADRRADPVPARRVAGVGVGVDAFHRRLRVEVAIAAVEPQAVLLDRAAVRDAGVVRLDDAGRLRQVGVLRDELVGQVVAARPAAGGVEELRCRRSCFRPTSAPCSSPGRRCRFPRARRRR